MTPLPDIINKVKRDRPTVAGVPLRVSAADRRVCPSWHGWRVPFLALLRELEGLINPERC